MGQYKKLLLLNWLYHSWNRIAYQLKFEKRSYFPDEESTETPILTLQGDKFSGTDTILIKTFQNGKLIKEDYIEYQVKGTRISGVSIPDIFGN